tara:strand:- start:2973 stop:3500 length:528 start_codon:yes stop_codon:yes gene_type:complete
MKKKNLDKIPEGTCVCSKCGERKSNIQFSWYANRFTKDGYRLRVNTICDYCSSRTAKELAAIKKSIAIKHPRPAYGDHCAICDKPVYKNKASVPDGVDGTWGWQCDHDHDTGEFRGWLCKKCNTGMGALGDDLESMLRAVQYLAKQDDLEFYTVWNGGKNRIASKVNKEYLKRGE